MKLLTAIRLVVVTALLVLFSGSMAFAHTGHDHGGQTPPARHVSYKVGSQSAAQITYAAASITKIKLTDQGDKPEVVVPTRDGGASTAPCGPGCCCCNGPSSCGMAGGCAVHAMTTTHGLSLPPLSAARPSFPASDIRVGRAAFGLERPPKA